MSLKFQCVALPAPAKDKFDVIVLKHNHRKGEDKEYANVLNRIRIGDLTDEDI